MIAIIPARGGSKGIPGKNIKSLNGKPLIAYTIEAALKSNYISRVIVTTDSEEIASVARQYGAEVPFIRPKYLAEDNSSAIDVYLHVIDYVTSNNADQINKFIVLLPTAPLRDAEDINQAIKKFIEDKATTLISVKEAETPPSWYLQSDNRGRLSNCNFVDASVMGNRQINKQYYIPNGAIYILDYILLKEKRTYYSDNTLAYIMPHEKSIDIDNYLDFDFAEFLLTNNI